MIPIPLPTLRVPGITLVLHTMYCSPAEHQHRPWKQDHKLWVLTGAGLLIPIQGAVPGTLQSPVFLNVIRILSFRQDTAWSFGW
jgi:hypothetical protein